MSRPGRIVRAEGAASAARRRRAGADPDLAALAIKQARGDLIETVFLIRAYRTILPRFGASRPLDTDLMAVTRRVFATFKDAPGGQVLGLTFDYTHRLIDFALAAEGEAPTAVSAEPLPERTPHIVLDREGLLQAEAPDDVTPPDLTREPRPSPPPGPFASRRWRGRTRASPCRSRTPPSAATGATVPSWELRVGTVAVEAKIPELSFAVEIGGIKVTECETVNQFTGSRTEPPQFTHGYGLTLGHCCERKTVSMALVDRAMRWRELGEDHLGAPAQDEEFVLSHCDNIQAAGFLEHIKLPHYLDFQAELELLRREARQDAVQ